MNKAIVTLKKGEGRMLKSGGAWIFEPPFQDMGTDVDEEYRSGDQRGVFREKASGRMGISEEDCGYFKLPYCVR